ncbi:Ppx/GppA phosphatase family protein [Varunaivibrio sulfuroxidans]|uniref:Ppx/GppA phosphatase n=1 Tax=Varunaivibrio sulfuroxidans TaxID=1773489 RepID=A0A4R3JAS1_9PROT|nr:Ppx/GppA phosphatase family protein [Varunaivibrio sulfuroxidans]TCS62968.1 Ppx/GppA phosphatase [Varunaivibrio sulfuroxidans]WES31954.1 Ppx/GppA phosphatase family protein [Varunaivibrio sulfuroxidans]
MHTPYTRRRRRPFKGTFATPPRGEGGRTYAAIDLGTNNCRMLIAKAKGGGFTVVDSFSRIVRLGEGVSASGRLAPDAIARTIDALKVCAGKISTWKVRRLRNVATEACRRAENAADFYDQVEARTGLKLETISAQEEAGLTLAGCRPLFASTARHALVFDIGGGSTEIAWVALDPGEAPRTIEVISLPYGVVTAAEEFRHMPAPEAAFDAIVARIDSQLDAFERRHRIARVIDDDTFQMLGTSGTVTTLGGIHLGLRRYDRKKVDGLSLPLEAIVDISGRILAMSAAERANHPCIGRQRGDLMIPGCAILGAISRRWPAPKLSIADRGIREGLLLAMIHRDRPPLMGGIS